ncbi:MAG: hypothetical protein Q4G54_05930 [Pelistega sp.]|nr:hypothetical protein [Pelistega sp.]
MNDKNEWGLGSRFVNGEGGIIVHSSSDENESDGWFIPPGSTFAENGELIVPPGYIFNEETETYFKESE